MNLWDVSRNVFGVCVVAAFAAWAFSGPIVAAETIAAAPEGGVNWWAIGAPIGGVILAALIPVIVTWLKKQKLVQKYHLEAIIDSVADRAVRAMQTNQKNEGLAGDEARGGAVAMAGQMLGMNSVSLDSIAPAVDAAYNRMKAAEKLVPK